MNLISIFISILFSFLSPSTTSNGNEGYPTGNDTTQNDGNDKKDKMGDGADYIIASDIMP
jgi:hypothetical protein